MHVPLYACLPFAANVLLTEPLDSFQAYFLAFTTVVSSISLVLDAATAFKWLVLGQDVGEYPHVRPWPKRQPTN